MKGLVHNSYLTNVILFLLTIKNDSFYDMMIGAKGTFDTYIMILYVYRLLFFFRKTGIYKMLF